MVKKIIFAILLAVGLFLCFYLKNSLQAHNDEYVKIKTIDFKVIDKLSHIRAAQKGYVDLHGEYAASWPELLRFIKEDKFPIVQVKEDVLKDKLGKDSLSVSVDTLSMVPVYDSLRNQLGGIFLSEIETLVVAPESKDTFLLKTKAKGQNFIEVKDPNPINPARKKGGSLKPLKFGSTRSATTKGNWE